MKKILFFAFLTLSLFQAPIAWGQTSDENWNLMLIRQDKVYPSMTNAYESALVDLKEFLTEKDVKSFNYFTNLQDDYYFSHVTPIKDLQDISNGIHSFMVKEVNDPGLDLIYSDLNEAIESYRYYIVRYRPEYSYVPEGSNWAEGSPYRKWSYYYFKPGTEKEVEKVLASWQQLYKSKGLVNGYRVFSGFIGLEQPAYIFTTWAENPLDYQADLQANMKLLGEEGVALWSKMMEYVNGVETIEGWYLPQYSFAPGKKLAE